MARRHGAVPIKCPHGDGEGTSHAEGVGTTLCTPQNLPTPGPQDAILSAETDLKEVINLLVWPESSVTGGLLRRDSEAPGAAHEEKVVLCRLRGRLRRHRPCAHLGFGRPASITAGQAAQSVVLGYGGQANEHREGVFVWEGEKVGIWVGQGHDPLTRSSMCLGFSTLESGRLGFGTQSCHQSPEWPWEFYPISSGLNFLLRGRGRSSQHGPRSGVVGTA